MWTDDGPAIRILIIDDHRLFAEAIGASLGMHGIDVVGYALSGEEGVALAQRLTPDVVVVDLDLPEMTGFDVGMSIRASNPETRIVALTALDDRRLYLEASRLDFDGYVSRYVPIDAFIDALRAASDGNVVFAHLGVRSQNGGEDGPPTEQLTNREREILILLTEGLDSRAICRRLNISSHTVRTHVHSIFTKLDVHSRLEAATLAVHHGLASDRPFVHTA